MCGGFPRHLLVSSNGQRHALRTEYWHFVITHSVCVCVCYKFTGIGLRISSADSGWIDVLEFPFIFAEKSLEDS